MTTLTFQNTALSVINQNNQIWLTTSEVGKALGYSNPLKAISTLFERHQDEFTPNMTTLIDMQTNGGMQKVRIFSLRGAHLIGMLSHTKVAKDFRKWVLDILDAEVERQPQQLALPEPEKTFTVELTEDELQEIAWLWFIALRAQETFQLLHPALKSIGSHFAPAVYGQAYEYRSTINACHKIIRKITANFDYDYHSNWRVLQHVKAFDPKSKAFQLSII